MLVTSTQRRGGEVFGEQLASGLSDRGWRISLRSLVRGEGATIEAEPLVDKHRSELKSVDFEVMRAFRREVASFGPDVVMANGGATLPVAVGGSLFKGSSAKLVYGSIGEPLYWARSPLARRRFGFLLRRCDLVTAVSAPTRTQLVDGLGVSPQRVAVCHPGVDDRFFDVPGLSRSGPLNVMILGSLSSEKGPLDALAAVEAASRHTPIAARFVGGGPLLETLQKAIQQRGLESTVSAVGPVDDVRPEISWADLMVLTSESEGIPGAVLEAAAAGVPAVAYDVGGVPDAIADGVTGVLVPNGNIDGVTDALVELAGDPERIARMASGAKAKMRAEFALKGSLDRFDDILGAVLSGRTP